MSRNYLSVVSLEEYPPNTEFWGRNFNNGEVIQLVLRSPRTGGYLPFRFVQMVMMHELAHCKEMNHGKGFWKVRNQFAGEMRVLWERGYTGEGLWGRGILLNNGAFEEAELAEGEVLPEHMCGGTFRSKGRGKRKIKPKITYKEQKERRIRKKFGVHGQALGADDDVKIKLEKGKRAAGKPRVAGSARGRELRAAAALARFEVKQEEEVQIKDEELVTDSEDEEDDVWIKEEPSDAIDVTGERLVDRKGNGMVKVCEDEDADSGEAQRELLELQGVGRYAPPSSEASGAAKGATQTALGNSTQASQKRIKGEVNEEVGIPAKVPTKPPTDQKGTVAVIQHIDASSSYTPSPPQPPRNNIASKHDLLIPQDSIAPSPSTCSICSVENDLLALTCIVCANVLKPDFVVGTWDCKSEACKESRYLNAGDVGICGVCGERRS